MTVVSNKKRVIIINKIFKNYFSVARDDTLQQTNFNTQLFIVSIFIDYFFKNMDKGLSSHIERS